MRRLPLVLRGALSLGILATVAWALDVGAILARLGALRPAWVLLALGVTALQGGVLAWRWRFTAQRLAIDLPFRTALSEYYLGNFLNQILPGGVTGDVSRAWRHARREETGPAVRAVVLERLSGQVVMTVTAAVSLLLVPALSARARGAVAAAVLLVAGLVATLALQAGRRREGVLASPARPGDGSAAERLWTDARTAILAPDAIGFQAATAVFTVATYIGVYLIAARALGVPTEISTLAPLVAPVLMTMLLPVSIAGWGVREAAAAALWGSVGLTPEDGVAISVAYGALVLVSTLPGALVLAGAFTRGPDRRARRHPDESAGPEDGAPPAASGSDRG